MRGQPHQLNVEIVPLESEVRVLKRKKHSLWRKYMRTKSQTDYHKYCMCRNAVRRDVRDETCKVEHNIVLQVKMNPKAFWRYGKVKTKTKTGKGDSLVAKPLMTIAKQAS